jgi:hypothetical protein
VMAAMQRPKKIVKKPSSAGTVGASSTGSGRSGYGRGDLGGNCGGCEDARGGSGGDGWKNAPKSISPRIEPSSSDIDALRQASCMRTG